MSSKHRSQKRAHPVARYWLMGVYLVYSLSKYQVITRSYQLNKDCTTISHSASPNGRSSTGVLGLLNAAKALHVYNHYLADIVPFKRDPLPFAKSNCGDGAWDTRYRSSWVAKKGLRRIVLWTSTLDSASRKLRSRFLVTVWFDSATTISPHCPTPKLRWCQFAHDSLLSRL